MHVENKNGAVYYHYGFINAISTPFLTVLDFQVKVFPDSRPG